MQARRSGFFALINPFATFRAPDFSSPKALLLVRRFRSRISSPSNDAARSDPFSQKSDGFRRTEAAEMCRRRSAPMITQGRSFKRVPEAARSMPDICASAILCPSMIPPSTRNTRPELLVPRNLRTARPVGRPGRWLDPVQASCADMGADDSQSNFSRQTALSSLLPGHAKPARDLGNGLGLRENSCQLFNAYAVRDCLEIAVDLHTQ